MEITKIYTERDLMLKVYDHEFQENCKDTVVIQKGNQIITLTEKDAADLSNLLNHFLNY